MKYTYIKKNNNKNNENNHNNYNKHNNKHKSKQKLRKRSQKHKKISININKNHKSKSKSKLLNKTQKKQRQIGGNKSHTKENFELHSIKDFDYDKYKIAKDADIDWKSIGGPPPEPNCCIC
jgi:hypothetical protein